MEGVIIKNFAEEYEMRMGERIPTRKLGESDLEYYVRRLTYNMIFHRIISYEIRDSEGNIHYESIDFLNTEEALINLDYKNVYEKRRLLATKSNTFFRRKTISFSQSSCQ
jgi:23S rRNA maturation-related 3'-5' exoribonuclease YhaM